jgi:hypothetical protein
MLCRPRELGKGSRRYPSGRLSCSCLFSLRLGTVERDGGDAALMKGNAGLAAMGVSGENLRGNGESVSLIVEVTHLCLGGLRSAN